LTRAFDEGLELEKLSKEYVIQQVVAHKDRIRDATDRLSDLLYQARKSLGNNLKLDEENSLAVRKIIHEIVSELSIIGGFCDNWTRDYIDKTATLIGAEVAIGVDYGAILGLELWAVRITGFCVNFNKTPFRLSDLKPIFSVLEKALSKK
jgi:tetrahydromethanopterin S-methyltransferase subunit G